MKLRLFLYSFIGQYVGILSVNNRFVQIRLILFCQTTILPQYTTCGDQKCKMYDPFASPHFTLSILGIKQKYLMHLPIIFSLGRLRKKKCIEAEDYEVDID